MYQVHSIPTPYNDALQLGADDHAQTGRLLRMRGWPVGRGDQDKNIKGAEGDGRQELGNEHGSGPPDWGWGATVDLRNASKAGDPAKYEVTVLVMCKPDDTAHGRGRNAPPVPMVSIVQAAFKSFAVCRAYG